MSQLTQLSPSLSLRAWRSKFATNVNQLEHFKKISECEKYKHNLWDVYQCTPTTRIGNLDFNMKRETKKFNYDCQAQSKLQLGWVGLLYSQLIHQVSGSTSKLGKQAWAAELTRSYLYPYPGHPSLFGIKWEYSDCHLYSVFKLDWTLRVESFTDRFAVPTPKKA